MSKKRQPDPSTLTTAQLLREIDTQKTLTDVKIHGLEQLTNQKFINLDIRLQERDIRFEHSAENAKSASDAALTIAKESVREQNQSSERAILKSEASTNRQIEQLQSSIAQFNTVQNDKIDDLKKRAFTSEGHDKFNIIGKDDNRALIALVIAVLSVIINLGTMLALFLRH